MVGLRAQLHTEVLDVDGQQEGSPAVVVVHGVDQLIEVERLAKIAELEARIAENEAIMAVVQLDACERMHAATVAVAPHRRRRRRFQGE